MGWKKKKGAMEITIYIEVPLGTSIYNDDYSIKLLEVLDENTDPIVSKGWKRWVWKL